MALIWPRGRLHVPQSHARSPANTALLLSGRQQGGPKFRTSHPSGQNRKRAHGFPTQPIQGNPPLHLHTAAHLSRNHSHLLPCLVAFLGRSSLGTGLRASLSSGTAVRLLNEDSDLGTLCVHSPLVTHDTPQNNSTLTATVLIKGCVFRSTSH